MRDHEQFYVLKLRDSERAKIVTRLQLGPGAIVQDATIASLADRIEREHGEDDLLSLATSRMRAWYYGRVRDLADDVLNEMLRGNVSDLGDYLHETVDGTDIVVYTYKAKAALLASDNEDAYAEEMGEDGAATPEARAYMALRADVLELLEGWAAHPTCGPEGVTLPEGFDLNDPETWRPVAETVEGGAS